MTVQRLSHADLEPTFRGGAPGPGSMTRIQDPGFTRHNLRTSTDWGGLFLAFGCGIALGACLIGFRRPMETTARSLANRVRARMGGTSAMDGPSAPFDPRTQELNSGVGALSSQQYRSEEEVSNISAVMEASEESFPASDAPSWTVTSSVGRCNSSDPACP